MEQGERNLAYFIINIIMRIDEFLHSDLISYLTESYINAKTAFESYRALHGLKKFGFNPAVSAMDNEQTIDDRYNSMLMSLIEVHSRNLNKEIYEYLKNKYEFKSIQWYASKSTFSQYIKITLKNDIKLEIRISDHLKASGKNTSIFVFNVYYYTVLTDKLKEKLDNFIQKFNSLKVLTKNF